LLPQKQEIEGIKYAHKIKKIESEIDWNLTALEISNKVRAFYPFPGTFTNGPKGLIKIITTQSNNDVHDQQPGTILNIGKKIFVACGNNTTLEILEVQKPGKNIISALAYLNGIKLSVGDKFGI
jgi:methionyl-tRNA formyltransferase